MALDAFRCCSIDLLQLSPALLPSNPTTLLACNARDASMTRASDVAGADVYAVNSSGETAQQIAVARGNEDVKKLIRAAAGE